MGKSLKGAPKLPTGTRDVFGKNLRALMKHAADTGKPDLSYPKGLETASGVSDDVIARALSNERSIDIDQLDRLAKAYNLEPWELLVPTFNPASTPAAQLGTLRNLLADHINASEAALQQLSGVNGKPSRAASRHTDGRGDNESSHSGRPSRNTGAED